MTDAIKEAHYNAISYGVRELISLRREQIGREHNPADYSVERLILDALWRLDMEAAPGPVVIPSPEQPAAHPTAEAAIAAFMGVETA